MKFFITSALAGMAMAQPNCASIPVGPRCTGACVNQQTASGVICTNADSVHVAPRVTFAAPKPVRDFTPAARAVAPAVAPASAAELKAANAVSDAGLMKTAAMLGVLVATGMEPVLVGGLDLANLNRVTALQHDVELAQAAVDALAIPTTIDEQLNYQIKSLDLQSAQAQMNRRLAQLLTLDFHDGPLDGVFNAQSSTYAAQSAQVAAQVAAKGTDTKGAADAAIKAHAIGFMATSDWMSASSAIGVTLNADVKKVGPLLAFLGAKEIADLAAAAATVADTKFTANPTADNYVASELARIKAVGAQGMLNSKIFTKSNPFELNTNTETMKLADALFNYVGDNAMYDAAQVSYDNILRHRSPTKK